MADAPATPYEVVIFNSNDDIIDMIRLALGDEGYRVGGYHIVSFKRGEKDVLDLLDRDAPRVVIYDVAPPYAANWAFFRLVAASPGGQRVRWIVTTTNVRALNEEADGHRLVDDPIEIWGKPYDLGLIVERVKALAGPPGGDAPEAAVNQTQ